MLHMVLWFHSRRAWKKTVDGPVNLFREETSPDDNYNIKKFTHENKNIINKGVLYENIKYIKIFIDRLKFF